MSDWQPIETAPKDGSWIWVFGARYLDEHLPPMGITRWVKASSKHWEQTSPDTQRLKTYDNSGWDVDAGISPTYWMPLPADPAIATEAGTGETGTGSVHDGAAIAQRKPA